MLFNSFEFIFLFVPLTALLFFKLGKTKGRSWATSSLTIASLVFYGWWNPPYLLLILASIVSNYQIGKILGNKNLSLYLRRSTLTIGILLNLGSIGYFKYAKFILDSINSIIDLGWNIEPIVLPLAISFFTFQQISYLVDTYRGETSDYRFLDYCLFVCFFPQLIAGPIVLHSEVMPQFNDPKNYHFRWSNISVGTTFFSLGLAKKVIFADSIVAYADPVFQAALDGQTLSFAEAWCGALAYTFQLYFDFSGYSDMAIGAARIFGICLPLNFYSPYKAFNISDFWRRWHMTLSRFLRDYLYIPLGGNRCSPTRQSINLIIVMLLGGLWHGAGWAFVLWGGLHGIYLVIHRQWQSLMEYIRGKDSKLGFVEYWIGRIVTLLAVIVSWVFFRMESILPAWKMLESMSGLNGISLPSTAEQILWFLPIPGLRFDGILLGSHTALPSLAAILSLLTLSIIAFCFPNTTQIMNDFEPVLYFKPERFEEPYTIIPPKIKTYLIRENWMLRWKPTILWSASISLLFGSCLALLSRPSAFLYFQF
jgi:D-alanyl-lipoteichoic acid acyltransferase DltB (MBOAT superfamily)